MEHVKKAIEEKNGNLIESLLVQSARIKGIEKSDLIELGILGACNGNIEILAHLASKKYDPFIEKKRTCWTCWCREFVVTKHAEHDGFWHDVLRVASTNNQPDILRYISSQVTFYDLGNHVLKVWAMLEEVIDKCSEEDIKIFHECVIEPLLGKDSENETLILKYGECNFVSQNTLLIPEHTLKYAAYITPSEKDEYKWENIGKQNLNYLNSILRLYAANHLPKNITRAVGALKKDAVRLLLALWKRLDLSMDALMIEAFFSALETGDKELVELFINNGVKIGYKNNKNEPALHVAVKVGRLDIVKLLLDNDAQIDAINSVNYKTALHLAIEQGNQDLVELLLTRGASVNQKDAVIPAYLNQEYANNVKERSTPLHLAIGIGRSSREKTGDQYCAKNHADDGEWYDAYDTFFSGLGRDGKASLVELLLKNKADANIPHEQRNNMTALHLAIHGDRRDLVELLLRYGARPDIKDANKKTPIDLAVEKKSSDIVEMLRLAKGQSIPQTKDSVKPGLVRGSLGGRSEDQRRQLYRKAEESLRRAQELTKLVDKHKEEQATSLVKKDQDFSPSLSVNNQVTKIGEQKREENSDQALQGQALVFDPNFNINDAISQWEYLKKKDEHENK